MTDFRNTLLVLTTVQNSPCYPARVLALQEKGLGFSVLEAEDLAVAADVQLALCWLLVYLDWTRIRQYEDRFGDRGRIDDSSPFQGRSSDR